MQELRSTEILDKEIQADARRKVENILKNAEEECSKLEKSVDERLATAKKEKEVFYQKKLEKYKNDLNATVPLEKQRFEVSFVQDAIVSAINEYLAGLSEEKRLQLVLQNLTISIDKNMNAYVYGFNLENAKKALENKIGSNLVSCEKTDFGKMVTEEDIGLSHNEGIILESEDRTLRCRLTLVEVFQRILDKNRAELCAALFGDGGNQ